MTDYRTQRENENKQKNATRDHIGKGTRDALIEIVQYDQIRISDRIIQEDLKLSDPTARA